jgi:hypothetical protein
VRAQCAKHKAHKVYSTCQEGITRRLTNIIVMGVRVAQCGVNTPLGRLI